jgi:hypothetical protein
MDTTTSVAPKTDEGATSAWLEVLVAQNWHSCRTPPFFVALWTWVAAVSQKHRRLISPMLATTRCHLLLSCFPTIRYCLYLKEAFWIVNITIQCLFQSRLIYFVSISPASCVRSCVNGGVSVQFEYRFFLCVIDEIVMRLRIGQDKANRHLSPAVNWCAVLLGRNETPTVTDSLNRGTIEQWRTGRVGKLYHCDTAIGAHQPTT